MSYNIDHVGYIDGGRLKIQRGKAQELLKELGDEIPEDNFFDVLDLSIMLDHEEMLSIENPWWYGEWSGNTYDVLKKKILPHTQGKATLLFVWAGGDSQNALVVDDGKVTEKKVRTEVIDD